jgi:cellulose biosynthesis protein BcsQ
VNIISVINAKGGVGKSTIAMNVATGLARQNFDVLLIDMDHQAQVTQWLNAGDGLRTAGTLAAAMDGSQALVVGHRGPSCVECRYLDNALHSYARCARYEERHGER